MNCTDMCSSVSFYQQRQNTVRWYGDEIVRQNSSKRTFNSIIVKTFIWIDVENTRFFQCDAIFPFLIWFSTSVFQHSRNNCNLLKTTIIFFQIVTPLMLHWINVKMIINENRDCTAAATKQLFLIKSGFSLFEFDWPFVHASHSKFLPFFACNYITCVWFFAFFCFDCVHFHWVIVFVWLFI